MVIGSNTIAQELRPSVDSKSLESGSESILALASEITSEPAVLGPFLSLWPAGFRTLNVLVDNFLNLPAPLLGRGISKESLSLVMNSSVHNNYEYQKFLAKSEDNANAALIRFANSFTAPMADVRDSESKQSPHTLAKGLQPYFSDSQIEWFALAVSLKGFLYKLSESISCETTIDVPQVAAEPSHSDLAIYLKVIRNATGSRKLRRRMVKGVSSEVGSATIMLESATGYSWPVLANLSHRRPLQALAFALHENLDVKKSKVGVEAKCLAALVYAQVSGNEALTAETLQLASVLAPDLSQHKLRSIVKFANAGCEEISLSRTLTNIESSAVMLARAAAPTPCDLNEITVSMVGSELTPAQIVEILTWVSMQELLGRLYAFYGA